MRIAILRFCCFLREILATWLREKFAPTAHLTAEQLSNWEGTRNHEARLGVKAEDRAKFACRFR